MFIARAKWDGALASRIDLAVIGSLSVLSGVAFALSDDLLITSKFLAGCQVAVGVCTLLLLRVWRPLWGQMVGASLVGLCALRALYLGAYGIAHWDSLSRVVLTRALTGGSTWGMMAWAIYRVWVTSVMPGGQIRLAQEEVRRIVRGR